MEYELGEGGFGRVIAATRKADNVPVRKRQKSVDMICKKLKNKRNKSTKSSKFQNILIFDSLFNFRWPSNLLINAPLRTLKRLDRNSRSRTYY